MSGLPTQGLRDILPLKKHIELEELVKSNTSKYVKLRFTRKQYDAFRSACGIFEVISDHPEFNSFVQLALNADVKPRIVAHQLTNPITSAPTKIVDSALKVSNNPPKVTYFTAPIEPTDMCKQLYSRIADGGSINTKYDILESNKTCITDIRLMLGKYIVIKHLKTDKGTIVNEFLQSIAHNTFNSTKQLLLHIDNEYVIPRNDKRIVIQMVNEIAVGG